MRRAVLIVLAVSLFLIVGASLFLGSNPNITGFVPIELNRLEINRYVNETQSFILSDKNGQPISLNSVRFSGSVIGDGDIRIFMEGMDDEQLLVYSSKERIGGLDPITGWLLIGKPKPKDIQGNAATPTPPEETLSPTPAATATAEDTPLPPEEVVKDPQSPVGTPGATPQPGELTFAPESGGATGSGAVSQESEIDFTKKVTPFSAECSETCENIGLNKNQYRFIVEVEDPGTAIMIDQIIYSS